MSQIERDPTTFQMISPATGIAYDFDLGSNGIPIPSPSHILPSPPLLAFEAQGSGIFPIEDEAVSAIRGTIQVEGSYNHIAQAQTIVYITPGLTPHSDCISVEATLMGKATVRIWDQDGNLVLQVSSTNRLSASFWLRFVWDSTARIDDKRFAALFIDGEPDLGATWSVDPSKPWVPSAAKNVGIRNGYGGTWPMNGSIRKVYMSSRPNTRF